MNEIDLKYINWKLENENFISCSDEEIPFSLNITNWNKYNYKINISKILSKINKNNFYKSIYLSKISDSQFLNVYDLLLNIHQLSRNEIQAIIYDLKYYKKFELYSRYIYDLVKDENNHYYFISVNNLLNTYDFYINDVTKTVLSSNLFKYITFIRN